MTHTISDQLLAQCSEFITLRFGLHYPKKRWRDLERGLIRAARDLGFTDAESCLRRLVTARLTKEQAEALVCHLTIGETYFFREKKCFEALQMHIFPALIDSRRGREQRLRVWCAGCSTGEEPYSVAILLHRMIADLAKWNVTILATDLNPASLRKGAHGEYGDWSFRDTPRWLKEKYFTTSSEGRRVISETIRKMVTFAPLNLAQDPYPALANNTNAMDVIFCRNVLMYFAPEQIKGSIDRFRHSLVDGGWLIVSPCETSHVLFAGYSTVQLNNTIFYRKDDHQRESPRAPLLQRGEIIAPLSEATGNDKCLPAIKQSPPLAKGDLGGFTAAPPNLVQDAPPVSPYEGALLSYRRGEYAEAAAKLAEFLTNLPKGEASPVYGEAAVLLTQAYANQGNLTLALEWSENAIAADRLNPRPYYLQAIIFQEKGADDAAIVSLKRAIYLDHGFVLAHFALANLTLRRGKPKEAARHLKNAASLLHDYGDDDILPVSEGMSARRLAEIIAATREGIEAGKGQNAKG
ncbi:MAG TPA: CheR family methyltransferase [Geobacteraceae bacterium]|nr:CheR family methyltransferase [Geobacteraceae bacterium]